MNPLAQTFFVSKEQFPSGVFIPSIVLYFGAKDTILPITVQIRTTNLGIPTKIVLPFAECTLLPAAVSTSAGGTTGTTFTFPSLVYCAPGEEYAVVIKTNSITYTVFAAEIGEPLFDEDGNLTTRIMSEQPYSGSLFISQNASSWTPDQTSDLKFKINRCIFDSQTGNEAVFANNGMKGVVRKISVISGGSGFSPSNAPTVTISGGGGTGATATAYINANSVNTIVVVNAGSDFTSTPTVALTGGDGTGATANAEITFMNVDVIKISNGELLPTDTILNASVNTVSDLTGTQATSFIPVPLDDNYVFDARRRITVDNASFQSKLTFTTRNTAVSPVVDTDRVSATVVEYRINNDVTDETNSSGGNALAKYVTRKVRLNNESTNIRVILDAYKPSETEIRVYYKILNDQDETQFDERPYVLMNQSTAASVVSTFPTDFKEYTYVPTTTPITYTTSSIVYTGFRTFAIKLVMTSTNTIVIPKIRNLRVLALA